MQTIYPTSKITGVSASTHYATTKLDSAFDLECEFRSSLVVARAGSQSAQLDMIELGRMLAARSRGSDEVADVILRDLQLSRGESSQIEALTVPSSSQTPQSHPPKRPQSSPSGASRQPSKSSLRGNHTPVLGSKVSFQQLPSSSSSSSAPLPPIAAKTPKKPVLKRKAKTSDSREAEDVRVENSGESSEADGSEQSATSGELEGLMRGSGRMRSIPDLQAQASPRRGPVRKGSRRGGMSYKETK